MQTGNSRLNLWIIWKVHDADGNKKQERQQTQKYSILEKKFQLILILIFITQYFSNKKYHGYYILFIY